MAHKIIPVLKFLYRMLNVPEGGEQFLETEEVFDQKMAAQAQQGQKPGPAAQDPALTQAKVALTQAQTGKVQAEIQSEGSDLQDKASDRQQKAASQVVESQDRAADRASHVQIAQMKMQADRQKLGGTMMQSAAEQHAEAIEGERKRQHDATLAAAGQQHEAGMAVQDHQHQAALAAHTQAHQAVMAAQAHEHESGMGLQQAVTSASEGGAQRDHEVKIAGLGTAATKKKGE